MKARSAWCRLVAMAALFGTGGCASLPSRPRAMPPQEVATLTTDITQGLNFYFPLPAVYQVTDDPTKRFRLGPGKIELFLFPDQTYRHVVSGGTLRLDQVTDEGRWSFDHGEVKLVSDGYAAVHAGTKSKFLRVSASLDERGVWPTVSDDWVGIQIAPAGYAYDRPITEAETPQLKDAIDRKLGRFSPTSLVWRFPMTGAAKGGRRPDGTFVLYGFESITISGVEVRAERIEISPDFKTVHIVRPLPTSGKPRSTPDLDVVVDDNPAAP